jgi:hypothetical protein
MGWNRSLTGNTILHQSAPPLCGFDPGPMGAFPDGVGLCSIGSPCRCQARTTAGMAEHHNGSPLRQFLVTPLQLCQRDQQTVGDMGIEPVEFLAATHIEQGESIAFGHQSSAPVDASLCAGLLQHRLAGSASASQWGWGSWRFSMEPTKSRSASPGPNDRLPSHGRYRPSPRRLVAPVAERTMALPTLIANKQMNRWR